MTDFQLYEIVFLVVVAILTHNVAAKYKLQLVGDFYSYYNQKTNIGYQVALLLMVVLALVIGFRAEDGNFSDSLNYRTYYYRFYEGFPFIFDVNAENKIFDNLFAWWGSLRLGISNFFFLMDVIYFGCIYAACKRLFPKDTLIAYLCYLGAFSTFSYSCNGIKAGVAASIFLLALSYYKNWPVCILLVLVSWGFHHSMILPVVAFVLSYCYKKPKIFFYGWVFCMLMAALHVSFFQVLFAGLTSDERAVDYLIADSSSGWEGKAGFRLDFILYSAMPVLVGYYAIFKKNIKSDMYNILLKTYLTSNAIWMLCMYVQFNNRIAYLSWFLYPIVLIFPLLNASWGSTQLKTLSKVVLCHLWFTLLMNLVYYGGLRKILGI